MATHRLSIDQEALDAIVPGPLDLGQKLWMTGTLQVVEINQKLDVGTTFELRLEVRAVDSHDPSDD